MILYYFFKIENFKFPKNSKKTEILAHRKNFSHEMNEINWIRWSRRLNNLASLSEINLLYFWLTRASTDFSQTVVSFQKLWFRVWPRAKRQTERIFEKIKGGNHNILSRWFQKNKFENFWTRNEENFRNISK
jgi:hypothetical protein